MKICLVTTFFGPHSFGGDAVFVHRLAAALLRRGHEVHVVYNRDAYEAVQGTHPGQPYRPPPGLQVHSLHSPLGRWSAVWTHQTGRLGVHAAFFRRFLAGQAFDVIHLHNVSLLGTDLFDVAGRETQAVLLMTASEHWLTCPLSLLWQFNRQVCEQPACTRCTLAAGRPPQFWRSTGRMHRAVARLDALIFPSRHTRDAHRARGIDVPHSAVLPYFLPDDWAAGPPSPPASVHGPERPYFAMAGRLIKAKGYQEVIPLMERFPEFDLKLAGTGPYEPTLRTQAAALPNVQFLGLLGFPALAGLYRNARALIVPSLFYETFCYVVLEAFSVATPVIAHRCGALPEWIEASGGGLTYETRDALTDAMARLAAEPDTARALGRLGARAWRTHWNETAHVDAYLSLIEKARHRKQEKNLAAQPVQGASPR